MLYSTYLGGNSEDTGYGIAVWDENEVFVTGQTASVNFFTYSENGIYQNSLKGLSDAFLAYIRTTPGSGIVYSSYVGTDGPDAGYDIAVQKKPPLSDMLPDVAYITGSTGEDALIVECDLEGNCVNWNLAGSGREVGSGIAVDDEGNIYVAGETTTEDLLTTDGTGSSEDLLPDAFLLILSLNDETGFRETSLLTYIGGQGDDAATDLVVVDSDVREVYLTGYTQSGWEPGASVGPRGGADAFLSLYRDQDGDGYGDTCDTCPGISNPNQGAPDADSDGDGMPDVWELLYPGVYPDFQGLDPCLDDADDHSDFDGWTNLQEYQASLKQGTVSPIDPDSKPNADSFLDGIFIGPTDFNTNPDDANLGNKEFPVSTLHAAVERLNRLEASGSYEIHMANGTYCSVNNVSCNGIDESDTPLELKRNVSIIGSNVVVVGNGDENGWVSGFIVSDEASSVTINGLSFQNFFKAGVDISRDNATLVLTGSSIQNCSAGISINGSGNTIGDVHVSNVNDGIQINTNSGIRINGSGNVVNDMDIDNAVNGILIDGANNQLTDVMIDNCTFGMVVEPASSGNTIQNATVANSLEDGIRLFGDANTIQNAHLLNNIKNGMTISGNGNTIIGGVAGGVTGDGKGLAGIAVTMGVEQLTLSGFAVSGYQTGIDVTTVAACLNLSGVAISACDTGLRLLESYQVFVDMSHDFIQSEISACKTGLLLLGGSSNNVVRNGLVTLNTGNGILVDGELEVPENNLFESMLVLSNAENGILFQGGFDNTVVNSVITDNNTSSATGGGYGGVAVFEGTAILNWNEIKNNNCWDVYAEDVLAGSPVDARFNWWGENEDPLDSDPIKLLGPIDYKPWLPYPDAWIGLPFQEDLNNNGLGDAWEDQYVWPPDSNGDSTLNTPVDDADNDGVNNLQEYQALTDPTDASDFPDYTTLFVGFGNTVDRSDDNLGSPRFPLASLNEAVNRANSRDIPPNEHFTIYIASGEYDLVYGGENHALLLNENIWIVGNGSSETLLYGNRLHEDPVVNSLAAFHISSGPNSVIFEGLGIRNAEVGIQVASDGACVRLNDVALEACGTGLQLIESYQTNIDLGNSLIGGCETGVEILKGSSNNTIVNGRILNNFLDGILIRGGDESPDANRLEALQIIDNGRSGVGIFAGSGNLVNNCIIQGNGAFPPAQVEEPYSIFGGVVVVNASASVNFSAVTDNFCWGVYAELDDESFPDVNAKYNWWGDGTSLLGPFGPDSGKGNKVSDHVVFTPWLGELDPWIGEPEPTDLDEDGLGDEWENQYLWDTETNTFDGDPDNDGATNLQEFQALTNPLDPKDYPDNNTLFVGFEGGDDDNIGSPRFPLSTLHSTLHGAIEKVNRLPEDEYMIYVAPGIYRYTGVPGNGEPPEPLILSQNVHLFGDGMVIIEGSPDAPESEWQSGFVVSQGGTNVTFEGMTILNFENGVQVNSDAACVNFIEVVIDDCTNGLQLVDTDQTFIDLGGSEINNSRSAGIEVIEGSSNNVIRNGFVSYGDANGILVTGVNEIPEGNRFEKMDIAFLDEIGVFFEKGFNNTIANSWIINNHIGAKVLNGSGAVATCTIANNTDVGILIENATTIDISGNLIYGSNRGVYLASAGHAALLNNTITDNVLSGVYVEESAANEFLTFSYNIAYEAVYQNVDDENVNPDYLDIYVDAETGVLDYEQFQFNDIGVTNLEWLPTTNLSVDPDFLTTEAGPYRLNDASICIDATNRVEPGRDIDGLPRPMGSRWDMGAIESRASFVDADEDGLPDDWEASFFDGDLFVMNDPHADYDNDGISNWEEFLAGSNPISSIAIGILQPPKNPYFIPDWNNEPLILEGVSTSANEIQVKIVGSSWDGVTMTGHDLTSWRVPGVPLTSGENLIQISAEDTDGNSTTLELRVVTGEVPPQTPVVRILYPTNAEDYTTAQNTVSLKGLASDNTSVAMLNIQVVNEGGGYSGAAPGSENWTFAGIPLEEGDNTITVTATDIFGFTATDNLTIIYTSEGATYSSGDLSGTTPSGDPLDMNDNNFLDEDESTCEGDMETWISPEGEMNQYPEDYFDSTKVGYYWPDCVNPDDDRDGMPDGWEILNGLDPYFQNARDDADEDTFDNLSEYQNGTDPQYKDVPTFTITVHDPENGSAESVYENWLPGFGKVLLVRAEWIGAPDLKPDLADFNLIQTSLYPGRAVNDPNPADMTAHRYPIWYYDATNGVDQYHGYDFGLTTENPISDGTLAAHAFDQAVLQVEQTPDGVWEVYLQCWDYAARAKIRVTETDKISNLAQKWIPQGSGENGIAAVWDFDNDGETFDNQQHPNTLDPNADIDTIHFDGDGYQAPKGDDFNNFEEYRGVVYTLQGELQHIRLNPFHKDLFVRGDGFDHNGEDIYDTKILPEMGYPFRIGDAFLRAGVDVYDITNWGHDATWERTFFVFYEGEATITIVGNKVTGAGAAWSTSWPKHEWEFKLATDAQWTTVRSWANPSQLYLDFDYPGGDLDSTIPIAYEIRMPLPHINALIVKFDEDNVMSLQDGRIIFKSETQSSQINPLGMRKWDWSTLAYAATHTTQNQGSMYGLAVALGAPINNYFNDRPYIDGNNNGLLDPISQLSGDSIKTDWKDVYENGELSPFNIDGDLFIELPVVSDPNSAGPFDIGPMERDDAIPPRPYTIQRVLMHVTTHEIAHALGGALHTDDPLCLMYNVSNNWKRDHHLSDYYRSLLRIHNKLR